MASFNEEKTLHSLLNCISMAYYTSVDKCYFDKVFQLYNTNVKVHVGGYIWGSFFKYGYWWPCVSNNEWQLYETFLREKILIYAVKYGDHIFSFSFQEDSSFKESYNFSQYISLCFQSC